MRVVDPNSGAEAGTYSVLGTYTQNTTPCDPKVTPNCPPQQTVFLDHPAVSPMRRAIGTFALGVAYACFPADATAQAYFSACRTQWLHYAGNSLVFLAGIAASPETGGLSLLAAAGAALSLAGDYEDLIKCMHAAKFGSGASGAGAGGTAETNANCDTGGLQCLQAYVE